MMLECIAAVSRKLNVTLILVSWKIGGEGGFNTGSATASFLLAF
jgi:hypothetical protein